MKYSKNKGISHLSGLNRVGQVPNLKPNQILIMPESNSMLDVEKIQPFINKNSKEWWVNKLPDDKNIKVCPGTTDLMYTGITIPLWADLRCRLSPDGSLIQAEFNLVPESESDLAGRIDPFTYEQTGDCPYTERRDDSVKKTNFLKLVNPFSFRTAKGYSVLIVGSLINPQPEFDVVPGIVNTDYYHTVNVVLNVKTKEPFYLKQGTPIAQLIVVKRKENTDSIIFGDQGLHSLHRSRGFGGPWSPLNDWRKGKYKREQRAWDR
jgi:hypothetical protein